MSLFLLFQITLPIEMVIVNSPVVDQTVSEGIQRHQHKEVKQAHQEDNRLQGTVTVTKSSALKWLSNNRIRSLECKSLFTDI